MTRGEDEFGGFEKVGSKRGVKRLKLLPIGGVKVCGK